MILRKVPILLASREIERIIYVYRLYIVRHAEADSGNGVDFDRPLNGTGEKQAQWLGKHLKSQRLIPELIIPSPAARASNTASIIAKSLELPGSNIITEPQIYQADLDKLLAVIRRIDPTYQSVLVVGHNTGVSQLNKY